MKYIKTKWTDIQWLKIGYCNWEYYKDRKQLCYSGKRITFMWNKGLFKAVLIMKEQIDNNNKFNFNIK